MEGMPIYLHTLQKASALVNIRACIRTLFQCIPSMPRASTDLFYLSYFIYNNIVIYFIFLYFTVVYCCLLLFRYITQNSTLHQHEYATHENPRRPHRQPIQLGAHSRPQWHRPQPCVSPPTIALSPGSTRAAARDGRRVEKGLEAQTHVSSPSPHLTLLRHIAAVLTPLLDDPSRGSVRPENRDPSLGAVSEPSLAMGAAIWTHTINGLSTLK